MNERVMSFRALIEEMQDVAAGKRSAPARPGARVFETAEARRRYGREAAPAASANASTIDALLRLLTEQNQALVREIASGVDSVAELAQRTGREESNVTRTLRKFENLGLVALEAGEGRRRVPRLTMESLSFTLDLATGRVQMSGAVPKASQPEATYRARRARAGEAKQ